MSEFTLTEQYYAGEAAGAFNRLLILDTIWTECLKQSKPVSPMDIPALRELTNTMHGLLAECDHHAKRLREIAQNRSELLEDAHRRLLNDQKSIETELLQWQKIVEKNGGISAFGIGAMDTIIQEWASEQSQLKEKMRIIENGGLALGDVGFGCGLYAGLALAALMTSNPFLFAGATVAAIDACQ